MPPLQLSSMSPSAENGLIVDLVSIISNIVPADLQAAVNDSQYGPAYDKHVAAVKVAKNT